VATKTQINGSIAIGVTAAVLIVIAYLALEKWRRIGIMSIAIASGVLLFPLWFYGGPTNGNADVTA